MLNLAMPTARPTVMDRLAAGQREVRTTLKSMWPWIIAALAIGSVVHGWVPADALESIGSQPWGVLAAVVGTEEQLAAGVQPDADVRLRPAAVATVRGGQGGCQCGVHVGLLGAFDLLVLVVGTAFGRRPRCEQSNTPNPSRAQYPPDAAPAAWRAGPDTPPD